MIRELENDKSEFVRGIMEVIEVKNRTEFSVKQLLKVWESSVKATHLFLSDDEIKNIKQYVPQALTNVPILVIAENTNGNPLGLYRNCG